MTISSPIELLHLANFNSTNVGNGALIQGLEYTLENDFPIEIAWRREAWDDYTFGKLDFDVEFVNKVNKANGLIVGGAVAFNGRDYNSRTGTRFELPFELWDLIKKPIIFYGLSYRCWPGQIYHHADKLKRMIEKCLSSKNIIFSVRNDGTKKWLSALTGFNLDGVVEVPDSAVFVQAKIDKYPEIRSGACNIIVSLNDEDSAFRYDGNLNRSRDTLLKNIANVLERLAKKYSINIILCPHYFDDLRMIGDLIDKMKPQLAHQNIVTVGTSRVDNTSYFYGRYLSADLAISMRVHSMSPCIGLGVPMIAITTQERMTDFLESLDLGEQAVNAFASDLEEKLFNRLVYTIDNKLKVQNQFKNACKELREQTYQFNNRIYAFLQGWNIEQQ
ncbi:MAG: polysaccharide pyruvyl transferase family protein [Bacteroidetes bacterium]|nr:polysaccharide pyruvyl transferase family protein [Bacteroidota bacterium]